MDYGKYCKKGQDKIQKSVPLLSNYTVQGPGQAGSRPFLLALTLTLRAGPPSAWPWPRVSLTLAL